MPTAGVLELARSVLLRGPLVNASTGNPAREARRIAAACLASLLVVLSGAAGPVVARAVTPGAPSAQGGGGPGLFEAALAQHGRWVRLRDGARAWQPAGVADGWQPYRDGQWAWTDDGWFWVSDEPWAWATYHHGLWRFDTSLGWAWLPAAGTWAPSRVVWRYAVGVVGWAPRTDDGLVLPSHWTFLPAGEFAGHPAAAAVAPSRAMHLYALSRRASGDEGPRPSESVAGAVVVPPAARRAGAATAPAGVARADGPPAARAGRTVFATR
jgi:hypothetical protein